MKTLHEEIHTLYHNEGEIDVNTLISILFALLARIETLEEREANK